jgi:hypothetical protein
VEIEAAILHQKTSQRRVRKGAKGAKNALATCSTVSINPRAQDKTHHNQLKSLILITTLQTS